MRLISAVSGVRIPAPPPKNQSLSTSLKERMNMRKIVTMASAGVFLLSLQGASLAQKEEKAPAPPPMTEKQAPVAPKAQTPAAPKAPEVKPGKTKAQTKAKKKSKSKSKKRKKARKTKKAKAPVE
jgi:hypothetical protein